VKEDNDRRDLGSGTLGSSSWAGRHPLLIVLRGDLGVGGGGGGDLRVGDIGDDLRVGGDLHLCMRGGGDDDLRVGGHLHLCVWGGSNDLHVGDGGDDLGTTATAHFGGLDLCVGGGGWRQRRVLEVAAATKQTLSSKQRLQ
jgi:hypothetical protein